MTNEEDPFAPGVATLRMTCRGVCDSNSPSTLSRSGLNVATLCSIHACGGDAMCSGVAPSYQAVREPQGECAGEPDA